MLFERFLTMLAAGSFLLFQSCTSRTQYGECVGFASPKKAHLEYRIEAWNVGLAVIFVETIIVPLVVILNEFECPVCVKEPGKPVETI